MPKVKHKENNRESASAAASAADLLEIGVVARPHGVRGQVKLRLHNPGSTALLAAAQRVRLVPPDGGGGHWRELEVISAAGELRIVRFAGVEDREAAEGLRGARVQLPRHVLEPVEEGQYYYEDLVGCVVVDEAGEEVGTVHALFEAGASDVLVIRQGTMERYVPLVEQWIVEVDLERRRILARGIEQWDSWPAGR